jgi:hypothetical protein
VNNLRPVPKAQRPETFVETFVGDLCRKPLSDRPFFDKVPDKVPDEVPDKVPDKGPEWELLGQVLFIGGVWLRWRYKQDTPDGV